MTAPVFFVDSRKNYLWVVTAAIPLFACAFVVLQVYGTFRRSWIASIICALLQLLVGAFLACVVLENLSRWPNIMKPLAIFVSYIAVTQLFAAGLNLCWGLRLRATRASRRWIRQFSMAELLAIVWGICSAADLGGLMMRR